MFAVMIAIHLMYPRAELELSLPRHRHFPSSKPMRGSDFSAVAHAWTSSSPSNALHGSLSWVHLHHVNRLIPPLCLLPKSSMPPRPRTTTRAPALKSPDPVYPDHDQENVVRKYVHQRPYYTSGEDTMTNTRSQSPAKHPSSQSHRASPVSETKHLSHKRFADLR